MTLRADKLLSNLTRMGPATTMKNHHPLLKDNLPLLCKLLLNLMCAGFLASFRAFDKIIWRVFLLSSSTHMHINLTIFSFLLINLWEINNSTQMCNTVTRAGLNKTVQQYRKHTFFLIEFPVQIQCSEEEDHNSSRGGPIGWQWGPIPYYGVCPPPAASLNRHLKKKSNN